MLERTCWRINGYILFIFVAFSNVVRFYARTIPGYYIQIVILTIGVSQILLDVGVSMYYRRKFGDFDSI